MFRDLALLCSGKKGVLCVLPIEKKTFLFWCIRYSNVHFFSNVSLIDVINVIMRYNTVK